VDVYRPENRVRISRLNHISKISRFEAFRSLKIVEKCTELFGLYTNKVREVVAHVVGGALNRNAVYKNGSTFCYFSAPPAFWGWAKTLRPPKDGIKEGGRGRATKQ